MAVDDVIFHPDADVDVAVIQTSGASAPAVALNEPDERIGGRLLLEPVLVMGYPRIPQALDPPALVVATSEVTAAVALYSQRVPTLILSSTARGGFSGGLVLSSSGTALGVIAQSLVEGGEQVQLGFLSALRVSAIIECLEAAGVDVPVVQTLAVRS
ncbi:MAG: trypsin-like peptidase domain-containing protein [Solirubrobacteraceae bacterium]|jgi:hypothetical protein